MFKKEIGVRLITAFCSVILMACAFFLFFVSPHVGSAYMAATNRLGVQLPLLTKGFSLSFTGMYDTVFDTFPHRAPWAWCLWLILLGWPAGLIVWTIRTSDHEKFLSHWCLGVIAYLCVAGAVAVTGFFGLLLPFSPV